MLFKDQLDRSKALCSFKHLLESGADFKQRKDHYKLNKWMSHSSIMSSFYFVKFLLQLWTKKKVDSKTYSGILEIHKTRKRKMTTEDDNYKKTYK